MMPKHRSAVVSSRLAAMFAAELQRFAWVNGTTFGRDVVPDVVRIRATSGPSSSPSDDGARSGPSSVNIPAGWVSSITRRITGRPRLRAAASAGESAGSEVTRAVTPTVVKYVSHSAFRYAGLTG